MVRGGAGRWERKESHKQACCYGVIAVSNAALSARGFWKKV